MNKNKVQEVLLTNSSFQLTASESSGSLTFRLQLKQDKSKIYEASFESINKLGRLMDYCENFQQVKQFFKEPSRVKIDEQKLMVSLNVDNPINTKKMVEIFAMKLQQSDTGKQGKKKQCCKCAQQIYDLKNKVAKLEQSLYLIIEESKRERKQREEKQKFYQDHYISKQQFNSQAQRQHAKELIEARNSLEAPNMLQNEYQCSMLHEFLPEERAQSYAFNSLQHQNDADHRKSSFLRSTFLNSQDTFTQQSVHRLQQKLRLFTDKTEQQIETLQTNAANVQTKIGQIDILASFNEAMLFESIHFSIRQGYHNILAFSVAIKYSIKQAQHLVKNISLPFLIENNDQEQEQEGQNFFSPDEEEVMEYGSCDFFSSQIQEQQEPVKYEKQAQQKPALYKKNKKRASKRTSKY